MMERDDIFKEAIKKDFQQKIPSLDFTEKVMNQVEIVSAKETVIEPLISKKAWLAIGLFYAILLLCPLFISIQDTASIYIDQINFINLDMQQFKSSVLLIFNIIFVFATLTLLDMLFSKKIHFR